jgi:asparagine synthase (glutamine-hydrolysing)
MCGIAVIIRNNTDKELRQRVSSMVESLHHRGPDANGMYCFSDAILGHARLSIVDLTTGSQPMLTQDKNLGVTFNGEIYGYQKIRKELDYNYSTTSDTELLLALYEKYETEMFQYLPGVFSFALWDSKKKKLLCGRDRFGEKPFYYAFGKDGELMFASEIKSIIASGLIEPKLNKQALAHYLQRFYVKPNETIYENIYVLPPAHYLSFKSGELRIKKYWSLPSIVNNISMNEAVEQFKYLFKESVRKQLVADVPVATFLSGGLDSTSVVTEAQKLNPNIRTLSFRFNDENDESIIAQKSAKKLGVNHDVIDARNYNLCDLMNEMSIVYDEPFADSSNIPTYLISKYASDYAKVVLTGDGADELLGGYEYWYNPLLNLERANSFKGDKASVLFKAKSLWKLGMKSMASRQFNFYDALYRFEGINKAKLAHYKQTKFFSDSQIYSFIKTNGFRLDIPEYDFVERNNVSDVMNMDLLDFMPGDILVKTDRASMANGLELRAPFLDVDLAEFCISLPYSLKIDEKESKKLLRRSYEKDWIEDVRLGKKKGFESPLSLWMQNKEIQALVQDQLLERNSRIFDVLDYLSLKNVINDDPTKTFGLLTLSIWMNSHKFSI